MAEQPDHPSRTAETFIGDRMGGGPRNDDREVVERMRAGEAEQERCGGAGQFMGIPPGAAEPITYDCPGCPDCKRAATCPSCELTKYGFDVEVWQATQAMLGGLIREAVLGRKPDFDERWKAVQARMEPCSDSFHDEAPAHPVSAEEGVTISRNELQEDEVDGNPVVELRIQTKRAAAAEARAAEAERVLRDIAETGPNYREGPYATYQRFRDLARVALTPKHPQDEE